MTSENNEEKQKARLERRRLSEIKIQAQKKSAGSYYDNENSNPCLKEQKLSLDCAHASNDASKECVIYFENYKNCKSFWGAIQKERRIRGIYPDLPPLEEREKIKTEFMKKLNNF